MNNSLALKVPGRVQLVVAVFVVLSSSWIMIGCGKAEGAAHVDAGNQGGTGLEQRDSGSQGGAGATNTNTGSPGGDTTAIAGTVTVSTSARQPRVTTLGVNYWQWMPSYGDDVSGTEAQIAALRPAIMRVGGYNNDANSADAFDDSQLDKAVMYAHAIGAEPLIQVPLLADTNGNPPTAATAATMVTYANVTKRYGVKYFSIGNEPDLYAVQGSRIDQTQPAIPNYRPSDYCATARAYAAAMKAVDPTIAIVGPDLSWHYSVGNDWLTPILQGCGDVFDIVAIHRYPFSSSQATLEAARGDAKIFGDVISYVRGLMQAAGYGDKPLALTEMNVAYDQSACAIGASPGTLGSALWLADGLGTAIEHNLWTSAQWDIGDADVWGLGLLGLPPSHAPRPEYYAYQLFADHFGPSLVEVTKQPPPDLHAFASRNRADNATDLIVVNWSASSAPLSFQITGLSNAPASAMFTVPASSISAVEIPDVGVASAWTYGDAQHRQNQGPVALAAGVNAALDAGSFQVDHACSSDASVACPKIVPPNVSITTQGTGAGENMLFGTSPYAWHSYAYAGSGQSAPTATVTPDGNGIHIVGGFAPPVSQNWAGVGLYFDNPNCIDGSSFKGVKFDISGDLGACSLALGIKFSGDSASTSDVGRGSCPFDTSQCYPPRSAVTRVSDADAGSTTVKVPFSSLAGGSPYSTLDSSTIIAVEWELSMPSGNVGCAEDITVENVAFY